MKGQNFLRGLAVILLAVVIFCGYGCCTKQFIMRTVEESRTYVPMETFAAYQAVTEATLKTGADNIKLATDLLGKQIKPGIDHIKQRQDQLATFVGFDPNTACTQPSLNERLLALQGELNGFGNRIHALESKPTPKPVIIRDSSWSARYALDTAGAVAEREQKLWEVQTTGELKFTYFYGYDPAETDMTDEMRTEFRQMINAHLDPNDTASPLFRDAYSPIQISGITSSDGSPEKNREINIARASDAIAQLSANGIDTSELEPQFGGYKKDKRGFLIVWKKQ